MIEVDSAQREARAREMRHEVVAQITVGTHRTFRILFAVQWPVALGLAWNSALPGDGRILFTLILGGTLCLPAMLFARAAPYAWWVRHFTALCQVGWSNLGRHPHQIVDRQGVYLLWPVWLRFVPTRV